MGAVGGSIDPCEGGLGPCDPIGSGACVDAGGGAYTCTCNLGYAGMDCNECDTGYVDNPMSAGECIVDLCDGDPCGFTGGEGASCTVDGPGAYTCTCNGNFDPGEDCGSCLSPFDGINCQCDTSMGQIPDRMGGCTTCVPAEDVTITLPFSGDATPTYTNTVGDFAISDVGCETESPCGVAFGVFGVGAQSFGDDSFDPTDSLLIAFFDDSGNPQQVSNVSIRLSAEGIAGTVDVSFDGAAAVSYPTALGQSIDLSSRTGQEIQVTSTSGSIFWQELKFDRVCP
jgi:hypothetical protein